MEEPSQFWQQVVVPADDEPPARVPPVPAIGAVDQSIGGFQDVLVGSNALRRRRATGVETFAITKQFTDLPTMHPS